MKTMACLLFLGCMCSFAGAYVVTFDEMPIGGPEFHVGDSFTSGGMQFTGATFYPVSGSPVTTGYSRIISDNFAGGAVRELHFYNGSMNFGFNIKPLSGVSLMFGNLGGDLNLSINNELRKVADFSTLNNTTIGGVTIFVTESTTSNLTKGSIFAVGSINAFGIGGQNLSVDNIIACIPEPAVLVLLAFGGLFLRKQRIRN